MGQTGVAGVTGPTGATGTPGIAEPNISVFTGGTLGTLGGQPGNLIALNGTNTVSSNILVMGPGNGADTSPATEVVMSEAGTAERLFVNVDNDPGTQMNNGIPSTFFFFLCDGNSFPASCGLTCFMTGPDTTCSDLTDTQAFAQSDEMSLWAYSFLILRRTTPT